MKKNSKLAKSLKFFNAAAVASIFYLALTNVAFATTNNTGTVNSFLELPYIKIAILGVSIIIILSILYSLAQSDNGYSKEKLQRQKEKLTQEVSNDTEKEMHELEKDKVEVENMILEEEEKEDKIKIYEPTIEELLIDSASEAEIVNTTPIIIDRERLEQEYAKDLKDNYTPKGNFEPEIEVDEIQEVAPIDNPLEKEMEKEVAEVEKPKRGRGRPRKVKVEEPKVEAQDDDEEDLTKQFLANMHSNMKNNN